MEEDVDVIARDAERGRDVFTVALFEHAERDDRALRVAELAHACAQANVIFGARECLFRGRVGRNARRCRRAERADARRDDGAVCCSQPFLTMPARNAPRADFPADPRGSRAPKTCRMHLVRNRRRLRDRALRAARARQARRVRRGRPRTNRR